MRTTVEVIVSRCYWYAPGNTWRLTVDKRIFEQTFPDLEAATKHADTLRGEKLSVIIRPTYNETDDKGRFFREWRSFDGGAFEECRWDY